MAFDALGIVQAEEEARKAAVAAAMPVPAPPPIPAPNMNNPAVAAFTNAQPVGPVALPGAAPVSMTAAPTEEAPAAAPEMGPYTPPQTQESMINLVTSDGPGGPRMTRGNLAAQQAYTKLNEDKRQRILAMADREEALGSMKGEEHDKAALDLAKGQDQLNVLDAKRAKEDEEHAAKIQKFQATSEEGRKAFLKASKEQDPHRMLGNAGTAIGFTISAMLGAVGQSLAKQGPNHAVAMINDALDRDFAGQQARVAGLRENVNMVDKQIDTLMRTGVDRRAAWLDTRANIKEGLANTIEQRARRMTGTESRTAGANAADMLRIQADEDRRNGYLLASKPSGKAPLSNYEVMKRTQELQKGQEAVRQAELKTQSDTAKANANGGEDVPEAAKNRRSKLATMYEGRNSSVSGLEALRSKIAASGQSAMGGKLPNLTNSEDVEKMVMKIQADYARGRGGPITKADQDIAEQINNVLPSLVNPATWSDDSALRRIDALLDFAKRDRDAVFAGQNAEDVAAINKTIPKPKANPADVAKRLNAKATK